MNHSQPPYNNGSLRKSSSPSSSSSSAHKRLWSRYNIILVSFGVVLGLTFSIITVNIMKINTVLDPMTRITYNKKIPHFSGKTNKRMGNASVVLCCAVLYGISVFLCSHCHLTFLRTSLHFNSLHFNSLQFTSLHFLFV